MAPNQQAAKTHRKSTWMSVSGTPPHLSIICLPVCSLLLICQLSSQSSPRWHWACFRAPLYRLTLGSWGDGAELMWEERSLVHGPLYTAAGDTELTLEVRWRSVMPADVETSVHLCCHPWYYRPLPANPPSCWPEEHPPWVLSRVAWLCSDIGLEVLTYGF